MSERTVTIPLEEYEALKNAREYLRYSHNKCRYNTYLKIPDIDQLTEEIRQEFQEEIDYVNTTSNNWKECFEKVKSKLNKIPKFIRRFYGAQ